MLEVWENEPGNNEEENSWEIYNITGKWWEISPKSVIWYIKFGLRFTFQGALKKSSSTGHISIGGPIFYDFDLFKYLIFLST